MPFQVKRIYDSPRPSDGMRVLVDRLWPRGVKKSDAHLDRWMKEVAPSTKLRLWFDHDPAKFAEFGRRYAAELSDNPGVDELRTLGRNKQVTLLYAAHDPEVNHALVLRFVVAARKAAGKKGRAKPPQRK